MDPGYIMFFFKKKDSFGLTIQTRGNYLILKEKELDIFNFNFSDFFPEIYYSRSGFNFSHSVNNVYVCLIGNSVDSEIKNFSRGKKTELRINRLVSFSFFFCIYLEKKILSQIYALLFYNQKIDHDKLQSLDINFMKQLKLVFLNPHAKN